MAKLLIDVFMQQIDYLLKSWKSMQLEQHHLPKILIQSLQNNQVQNDCNSLIAKLNDKFPHTNSIANPVKGLL